MIVNNLGTTFAKNFQDRIYNQLVNEGAMIFFLKLIFGFRPISENIRTHT
jgi:hypothetical protein